MRSLILQLENCNVVNRGYKTSAFCSKYRAASHLAANFPNFPGEVAAACEIRGGEDDGWGRLLTVAGVTSPRRRQPTLYNFTHWLGRRQIRAKYFQKVVKGSVTELSCSVDCIRCVTDLPPPPPTTAQSDNCEKGSSCKNTAYASADHVAACISATFFHFDNVPQYLFS